MRTARAANLTIVDILRTLVSAHEITVSSLFLPTNSIGDSAGRSFTPLRHRDPAQNSQSSQSRRYQVDLDSTTP